MKYRKIKPFFRHYRNFLLVFVLPFIIIGGYLNVFHPVSDLRINEFNIVLGLFLSGIAVLTYASYAFRKKNKYLNLNNKTIVTLHTLAKLEGTGKTYYLNRYNFLADNYNLVLFTNDIGYTYFKSNVPNANVITIPTLKIPGLSQYLSWLFCRLKLIFINYDLLFLRIRDMPFSFYLVRKPILCHLDVDIYQSVGYKDKNSKIRFDRRIYLKLVAKSLHRAKKITAPFSAPSLENFATQNGILRDEIDYTPHAIDLNAINRNDFSREQLGLPKDKFIAIYSGSFNPERGIYFLLEAMLNIKKKTENIVFAFVGQFYDQKDMPMPLKEDFLHRLKKLGLEENMLIFPPQKFNDLTKYLCNANVGISILKSTEYFKRSIPQKVFEYFAAGLPVIANDIPTHLYVRNGFNGFIIKNFNEFAEAVLKLYNDGELLKEMSKNALESVKEYDWNKIKERFGEVIDEIIE